MNTSTFKRTGFTLVELLIVIAIIGLLSTLAVTGVTVTRSKARDAKRSADIAQIQKAMALYATSQSRYPIAATELCLTGTDAVSADLVAKDVMKIVPGDPTAKTTLPAAAGGGAHCYTYQSAAGTTYAMRYYQERASDRGPAGATITVGP
ncbi:prepilin-type N-terminal cleavage/methylation domain-containing protein [Candidatus Uhrbacteria bacterium]|nr:prepilin-type N-terminal cleavage/methylation domain-containing protein [Candidatus Uhrbacteria bacterium]